MLHADDRTSSDRQSYERLLHDHVRIEHQCRSLLSMTRAGSRYSPQASDALFGLAVTLADHLGVEDEVLDLTAIALAGGWSSDDATAMHDKLEVLRRDWSDFLAFWTTNVIAERWRLFGDAVTRIVDRLVEQVDRENELLYVHALACGTIKMGDVAKH